MAQAVTLQDAEVQAFLTAGQLLPSFGVYFDHHIDRYAALLCSFMYGNLAWSALPGRYGLAQEAQAYALDESHAPPSIRTHERLMRTTPR